MKGRYIYCVIMAVVHLSCWTSAASGRRPSAFNEGEYYQEEGQMFSVFFQAVLEPKQVLDLDLLIDQNIGVLEHLQFSEGRDSRVGCKNKEAARIRGLRGVGSRPPNCEHKCGSCEPCVAVQVPASRRGHQTVHYANYEPEGWKCKCGSSFSNP